MSKESKEIYADVKIILGDWREICQDHSLLERGEFLEKMHTHILTLNEHSEYLKKHKKIYGLIFHILHTPAGAPGVTKETLYDSARSFSMKNAKNSSFHLFLEKSLTSSNESDNFLFNSLSIVGEELKKVA